MGDEGGGGRSGGFSRGVMRVEHATRSGEGGIFAGGSQQRIACLCESRTLCLLTCLPDTRGLPNQPRAVWPNPHACVSGAAFHFPSLGWRDHLKSPQIRKNGRRLFCSCSKAVFLASMLRRCTPFWPAVIMREMAPSLNRFFNAPLLHNQ